MQNDAVQNNAVQNNEAAARSPVRRRVPMSTVSFRLPLGTMTALVAPGLCAIHCVAAPVLVGIAPALAESPPVELLLTGASGAFAAGAVYRGVARHGQRRVWVPVVLGLLLVLAGHLGRLAEGVEHLTAGIGSLGLAAAIVWNARLGHRRTCKRSAGGASRVPLPGRATGPRPLSPADRRGGSRGSRFHATAVAAAIPLTHDRGGSLKNRAMLAGALLLALQAAAGAVQAQSRPFAIGIAGGGSFPSGEEFSAEAGTGYHVQLSVAFAPALLPVGVRADLLWQELPDEHGGSFREVGGLGNAVLALPVGPARPYLLGGIGAVRHDDPDEPHGDHVHEGESETAFAWRSEGDWSSPFWG